jgi:hypothetical protein
MPLSRRVPRGVNRTPAPRPTERRRTLSATGYGRRTRATIDSPGPERRGTERG